MPVPKEGQVSGVAIDEVAISAAYSSQQPALAALLSEAVHTLESALDASGIKYHSVERRVKSIPSLLDKCRRQKCTDPINQIHDLVGVRVICLFKDDIDKVGAIIGRQFSVKSFEDKRNSNDAPIGYMSVHYVCEIPATYSGPRYDSIKKRAFEVQVRTLCMHSWAAISHYLDYKGEWDVPRDLRMALSALSGLFYVADNEFQKFYQAREAAVKKASSEIANSPAVEQELNLDTLVAFLDAEFPHREKTRSQSLTDFIEEARVAGYKNLNEIIRDVREHSRAFKEFEDAHPLGKGQRFTDIGVVRCTLEIASPAYKAALAYATRRRNKILSNEGDED